MKTSRTMTESAPARRSVSLVPLAAAALAATLAAAPLAGQMEPPPPLPMGEVAFPDFAERTLSNGARLIVVQNGEVPFVSVNLVLRGGTAIDPVGQEGMASMAASLLDQGTATRSGEEIADALDFLGASVGAGASADYTSVSASGPVYALDEALEIMADVVMNPTFPEDKLELFRTQTLSALQVAASQAATVASQTFGRILYGDDHPYGRVQTPESVRAITRESILAYHDEWYSPATALFVVAGDISADEAVERLETAFAGWDPTPVGELSYPDTPRRAQPEIFLVHKPGSVQAEVRVGHLLMEGSSPDWTALSVANQILGGGPSGRLFKVLREERGYTYGAGSSASRSRDRGQFTASMAVRNEVTGEAIDEMLSLIGGMRDEPIPAAELQRTKDFLIGSFPLGIETPQQVASQVSSNRLLGLPEDAIETYRDRVAALTPESVQEVFQRQVRPSELVVVVVGDATQIRDQLQGLGPVTLLDDQGESITMADLAPRGASETLSAASLEPGTMEFQVLFNGQAVGSVTRTLALGEEPGTMTLSSTTQAGPQTIEQSLTFRVDDFAFVSTTQDISMQGQSVSMRMANEDGRAVGSLSTPMGEQPIDIELPEGAVVGEMTEVAVWIADLETGKEFEFPAVNPQTGGVENIPMTVGEIEEITVPAGTFQAYRIEVGGSQPQTFWARAEGPHWVLRVEPAGQPIVVELSALPEGG